MGEGADTHPLAAMAGGGKIPSVVMASLLEHERQRGGVSPEMAHQTGSLKYAVMDQLKSAVTTAINKNAQLKGDTPAERAAEANTKDKGEHDPEVSSKQIMEAAKGAKDSGVTQQSGGQSFTPGGQQTATTEKTVQ